MKPWDIIGNAGARPDDERLAPLWEKIKPSEFFFAAIYSKEMEVTFVYITPGKYFDEYDRMYPDSMPILKLLPHYLIEVYESIYEADMDVDNVIADMIEAGFIHNWHFQEWIAKNEWFNVDTIAQLANAK